MAEEALLFTTKKWKEIQSPASLKYLSQTARKMGRGKKNLIPGRSKFPSILTSKMLSTVYKKKNKTARVHSGFQFSEFARRSCRSICKQRVLNKRSHSIPIKVKFEKKNEIEKADQQDVFKADEWVDNIKYGKNFKSKKFFSIKKFFEKKRIFFFLFTFIGKYEAKKNFNKGHVEKGEGNTYSHLKKEPKVNMKMIDSILGPKEDSYGLRSKISNKRKNYDLLNLLKNRNIASSSQTLEHDDDESEKIRQAVVANSRKFYSNNKKLLKNLVVSKIANLKKKKEWESMVGEEDHKIRTVIQSYISRFEIFKTTFISAKKELLDEVKLYLRDNLQKFMRKKIEKKSRENFLQEMREMANSISVLISDEKKLKLNIKNLSEGVRKLELKKMELVKTMEKMKKELKNLKMIHSRNSAMFGLRTPRNKNKISNIGNRMSLFPESTIRSRSKIGFDVIEYSKSKSKFGSNLINPSIVIKAKMENLKEEIKPIYLQIDELERKISIKTHLLNQCRTLALANIQILLSGPDIIFEIRFDIVKCIMGKYKLGENCTNDQIGGDFTLAEKQYLINCAKLELKWEDYRNEKRKNGFGRSATVRGVYKSDLIYPSPELTRVNFFKIFHQENFPLK